MMLLVWSYRTFYIPVSFFFVSNHAGSLMFLARLCILEPFSFRDGWRDGGMEGGGAGGLIDKVMDGGRAGLKAGAGKQGKPQKKTAETRRARKEKPREAPLQLRSRISTSLCCSSCNLIKNCCQTSDWMHQLSYMYYNPEPGIAVCLWAVLHQEHSWNHEYKSDPSHSERSNVWNKKLENQLWYKHMAEAVLCLLLCSAHVCKKNIIYPFLIVLGAQLRNINDSCLQPQKSLGPLNRSNLTLSLVGGGGAVWGDVGRAASTSSPTRTQPDRTHRSAASRRTHEDGRKPEDERGGFHNKSRVLFCFFNDWKQKKPFIDHVCPSFTHVCSLWCK